MDPVRTIERASTISIASCEACPCGSVHIRLHDAEGRIFATASMPPAIACQFAQHFAEHLVTAAEQGLSAIRCEGNA